MSNYKNSFEKTPNRDTNLDNLVSNWYESTTDHKNGRPEKPPVETARKRGINTPSTPLNEIEAARRIVENVGNSPEAAKNQPLAEIDRQRSEAGSKMCMAENECLKHITQKNRTQGEALRERYVDPKTGAEYVNQQLAEFANRSRLDLLGTYNGPESVSTNEQALNKAIAQIESYFNNPETGTKNPEKLELVKEVVTKLFNYLEKAQKESELTNDLSAVEQYQIVMHVVITVLYQDRAATENLLGDHGIRHIFGHNVRMCEAIADQLENHNQTVTAKDRLLMILTMAYHDLGYAMDPVREPINQGGFGADAGHGILAAKFMRELSANSLWQKLLSPEDLQQLHQMILTHDYTPETRLTIGDESEATRRRNILEIIRIADNTHAFEDKLPELLYAHPNTLKYLRLIDVAIQLEDQTLVDELKTRLKEEISQSSDFSEDDKLALTNAVKLIGKNTAKFTVPRICGNKPEVTLNGEGNLTITVQESEIHRMVVGMFSRGALEQFQKFVKDLTGTSLSEDAQEIHNPERGIQISLRSPEPNSLTNYQERVIQLVKEPAFQNYLAQDNYFAAEIASLSSSNNPHNLIKIQELNTQRKNLLRAYLRNLQS